MYLLKKKKKKNTKSEETSLLTCTFMVPVGISAVLELVLAVHSYHMYLLHCNSIGQYLYLPVNMRNTSLNFNTIVLYYGKSSFKYHLLT